MAAGSLPARPFSAGARRAAELAQPLAGRHLALFRPLRRWAAAFGLISVALALSCVDPDRERRALALAQASDALVAAHPELPLARGRQVFAAQCASCHQLDGQGTKNAIPPLAGHVPLLLAEEGGRTYLAHLVLYGVNGSIQVLGRPYLNQMPSLGPLLRDEDIVAALAWASMAWGNAERLGAGERVRLEDVQAARRKPLRPKETYLLRPQVGK